MKTGSEPLYLDSSALVKIYYTEPESRALEAFLLGRDALLVSDLGMTEVTSAIARHVREGRLSPGDGRRIREAMLHDVKDGVYRRVELAPVMHRRAEDLLMSAARVPLRAADALHLSLALAAAASGVVTYDQRLAKAAVVTGRLEVHSP